MNTAGLLVAAMVMDAVMGEPRWLWSRLPHPAIVMGRAVSWLDRTLNVSPNQRAGGMAAVLMLAIGAWILGLAVSLLGAPFEILCVAILLAQRSLVRHVQAVADALRLSVGDGRQMVAMIVSRDCREMTIPQVARAAIESASENLSDGIIAPAFWFLIAGLPGLLLYKVINTADSMIGYRNEKYAAFGWAAARTDDVLNLIPARLTGFLIAVCANQLGAWGAIARDARQHRSPNAGWPEAAMARALNVALAGPRSYDGRMQPLAWVNGEAQKDIGPDEIDAAIAMLWRVWATSLTVAFVIACLGALSLI